MADALNDDWFVQEDIVDDGDVSDGPGDQSDDVTKNEKPTKQKKKKGDRKRKMKDGEETSKVEKKKKKKRKKKPAKPNDGTELPSTAQALWNYFEEELKKTLSELELSEIRPEHDEWFLKPDVEHENISSYLKEVIEDWQSDMDSHTKLKIKSSPAMLIISSGGQRAADLLRETKAFRGEQCKCTKLFAKHFKVSEQVKYLKSNIVHLGVGTPNRILKLIEEDGLDLSNVKYIIIDWSWRDVKTRQITTMPGVKEDLRTLFEKYLFERCRMKSLQVGLL